MPEIRPKAAVELASWLWPTFVKERGAVFIRQCREHAPAHRRDFSTLLEFESFVNHVHVLDLFDHEAGLNKEPWWNQRHRDFAEACRFGAILCESWAAKLTTEFPEEKFAVYFTRDDCPIVRFHKIRDGEGLWIDPSENRKLFRSGGAALIETPELKRFGKWPGT